MRQTTYPSTSLLRFPATLLPAVIVSACVCLSSVPTPGWTEEPATIDERLLRMEQEIRLLHKRNEELQEELKNLRQESESRKEAPSQAVQEAVPEAESPTEKVQKDGSPPATRRERGPYVGVHLAAQDGQYELDIGGRITARYTGLQPDYARNDNFSVKRARLFSNAHILGHYDLRIQVEFSGDPKLKDGYLDINYFPWARLTLGQFKVPFTWEYLESHKYIDFAERSIAVDNMRFEGRDIGGMLHGRIADGVLRYQLAVLNGTGENTSDDNDAKDIAGRLVLRPFYRAENDLLFGLHLGVSGTWGKQDTDFSSTELKTVAGTDFVDFTSGTVLKGDRSRLGTEFMWPLGPASLKTEWMWMWLDDFQRPPLERDVRFNSWYVSGSYLLTGETKPLGRMVPDRPFNPFKRTWGAWELAARYSRFDSDKDLFRLGMASGTDQADAYTLALNWYLNELLRVTLHYEYTEFDDDIVIDGETQDDEHAILLQSQLEF